MTTETGPRRVCLPCGFTASGKKVRAVCSCGYWTTPRVDESRALVALLTQHGFNQPVCQLCGKDHHGHSWEDLRNRYVQILTDPATGDEFLVCRDMPKACRDGAAQQQVHLDRAAFDAFGIEKPRPTLRLVGGSAQGDQDVDSAAESAAVAQVDQMIEVESARMQADIARDAQDEFSARRYGKALLDRYQRLTAAELARMDTEIAVVTDAENALHEGRDAFTRGELDLAEPRLRVAATHRMGDAVVYLVALYRRQQRHDLAAAWRMIALNEGFGEHDLIEAGRSTNHAGENPAPSEE